MIEPLEDWILVEPSEPDKTTVGGIMLPDAVQQEKNKGSVLAIGPGRTDSATGERLPMNVDIGDEVYFRPYSGVEITDDAGTELLLIPARDCLVRVGQFVEFFCLLMLHQLEEDWGNDSEMHCSTFLEPRMLVTPSPRVRITAPVRKLRKYTLTYYSRQQAIGVTAGSAWTYNRAVQKACKLLDTEMREYQAWIDSITLTTSDLSPSDFL